jgi:hypothetical protein
MSENIIKKQNSISSFENIEKTSEYLSRDISNFLAEDIEELNISSYMFRSGMERSISRVLGVLIKHEQQIVIFPDSIPGFTMMTVKKEKNIKIKNIEAPKEKNKKLTPIEKKAEERALNHVMDNFFQKNKQKVLFIENSDMIFVLFPVNDTRKNLKEMELYITF